MRILTISVNAWNNTIATGNTFSNFFSSISESDEIANIYCRNENIDNSICSRYFRITERDIINSLYHFNAPGVPFDKNDIPCVATEEMSVLAANSTKGNTLRKKRPALLLFAREFVWSLRSWQNKKLKSFLDEFKPEVIYMHGHANWYMHNILWFCAKYTGAKVALYSGDDVYSCHRTEPLHRLYHWILRKKLRKSFVKADVVFGGSPQLCKEYGDIFHRDIIPLYKVCNNLKSPCKSERSFPLHAVYCGNLLYGRENILAELVEQIKILNSDGLKIQMHIYTANPLSDENRYLLNDGENCLYQGKKPFSEIVSILNECDFSILAESFDPESIKMTRLSFSTKIIDYMQATSALICVGPSNIGSVDYIKRSGIGIYVPNTKKFSQVITPFLLNPSLIDQSIQEKYEYAMKFHSKPVLIEYLNRLVYSKCQ